MSSFLMTMLMLGPSFLAQATAPSGPAAPAGGAPNTPQPTGINKLLLDIQPFLLPIAALLFLYVFVFRSKRKQESQRRELLNAVKRGDKVQTIGGIIGNVTAVEDNRIQIKVDESSNTKIWFARSAIHRVYGEDADKSTTPAKKD